MEGGRKILSYEDERVVKLTFDNEAFKKGVADTLVALRNLEKALDVDPKTAARSFDNLSASVYSTERSLSALEVSAEKVKVGFSMLQVAGVTAFANLTNSALQFGKSFYNNTLGLIQSKGFTRALNLENAKFQIEGLDKSWKELKEDILYGVKDTAYGLDEAARVASQLAASNVQAGNDMKRSLRAISGVAAMTNSSYSDIGSIFTTMAGQGKVMGHELTRLSYRGINAAAKLAEYYREVKHVSDATEASIRDMASKGKISFQEFANAMDWAFGEHAKEANKTFQGAMSNMKAALGRLGEAFQTPQLDFRRRIAISVIPMIDKIAAALNKYAVPGFTKILDLVASWSEKLFTSYRFINFIYNVVIGVYSWIHEIVRALWELGVIAPDISDVANKLADMTDWMVLNGERAEKFRNIIKAIAKGFQILLMIIDSVIYILEPVYKPILNFLNSTVSALGDATGETDDLFTKIQNVIKVVTYFLRLGVEIAIKKIVNLINDVIFVLRILSITLTGVVLGFVILVKGLINFVRNVTSCIKGFIAGNEAIKKSMASVYEVFRFIFENIVKGLGKLLTAITTGASVVWDKISWLFKDNTVKTTVVVDTVFDKVMSKGAGVDSLFKGDASKSIDNVTKSVENYSDAASKVTSKKGAASLSSVGGSGYFVDAIDPTIFEDIKDKAKQAAEESKNIDKSFGKMTTGLSNSLDESDKAINKSLLFGENGGFAERFSERIEAINAVSESLESTSTFWKTLITGVLTAGVLFITTLELMFNGIIDLLTVAAETLPEISSVLVDSMIDVFSKLNEAIPELLGGLSSALSKFNFWDVIKALMVVEVVIGSIFAITLATNIANPAVFISMSVTLLAFGAVLATLGAIAYFVDLNSYKVIILGAIGLIAAMSWIFKAVAALRMATAIADGITQFAGVMKGIQKTLANLGAVNVNVSRTVKDLGGLLKDLALLVGVTLGFVFAISIYIDKFGDEDSVKTMGAIAGIIGGAILGIMTLLTVVVLALSNKSGTKSISNFTWKLKGGINFTNDLNTSLVGLIGIINSISIFIAILSGSVMMLSFRDFDQVKGLMTVIVTSTIVVLGVVTALMVLMAKALQNKAVTPKKMLQITTTLKSMSLAISVFMLAIGKFVVFLATAGKLISTIPEKKINKVTLSLGVIVASVGGLMTAYAGCVKMLSKIKFTKTSVNFKQMTILLYGFIFGMSGLIAVIAISTRLLASANASSIKAAGWTIGLLVAAVSGLMVALIQVSKTLSAMKPEKAVAMSKTLGQMAAVFGILIGAVSSIALVTAVLAKVLDSITDTSSIIWSLGIIAGVIVALSAFYLIINKTANLMPNPQAVYGAVLLTGAMVSVILAIAAFMKIISTIDLNAKVILVTVGSIIVAIASMALLSKFISGGVLVALAAGWKGLLVVVGFIAAMAGAISLIGMTIGYVGENISKLAKAFEEISNVPWSSINSSTEAMKVAVGNVMATLGETLNIKSVVGIAILALGLKLLSEAVEGLAKVRPDQLESFANAVDVILQTFKENYLGAIVAVAIASMFVMIGWSLASGMVGFIIFASLVPLMVKAVNKAIVALGNLQEITLDISKYTKIIDDLIPLAGRLVIFGIMLSIGAGGLAIGGLALLAGAWLLQKAFDVISETEGLYKATKYIESLIELGFYSIFAGWFLSSGAGMLAIGALLLIASVGLLKAIYKIMKSDYKKIDMAIGYMGGLILLGVTSIVAGASMILGSGILLVGSLLFLASCGALALSMFALQKAFENADFDLISNGLDSIVKLCETLQTVGETLVNTMPVLVEGTALLAAALFGFMISGVELYVGAIAFGAGLVALYEAFTAIDPQILVDNMGNIIKFIGLLALVGTITSVALIPFAAAAVLFSASAGLVGAGIVLFSTSLFIGSLMLLGSSEFLGTALTKLTETFSTIGFLDIALIVANLMTLGIGVIVTGFMFSVGGLPFVFGSTMILIASAILEAATDKLGKALDTKRVSKIISGAAMLIGGLLVFTVLSPILLAAGAVFIIFATEMLAGAALFEEAAEKLKNGTEMMEEAEESGKNAVIGFANGIADKTGLNNIIESTSAIGNAVLDTLSTVLDEHSPSRETFDRGLNAVVGFLNGLGIDGEKVAEKVRPIGYAVCDTLDGFNNPLEAIGEAVGLSGGDGLLNGLFEQVLGSGNLQSIMDSIGNVYGSGLTSIFGQGNDAMIAELQSQKALLDQQAEAINRRTDMNQQAKEAEWKRIAQERAGIEDQIKVLEEQKAIFDIDTPNFEDFYPTSIGGASSISDATSDALAEAGATSGSGSSSDLAKSAGSNVGKSITNNTYNFVQNNYSPEPIDRTELYTQTQNQLDSWYKFVRDNG